MVNKVFSFFLVLHRNGGSIETNNILMSISDFNVSLKCRTIFFMIRIIRLGFFSERILVPILYICVLI